MELRFARGLVVATALLALAGDARADEEDAPKRPVPVREWYGYQTLTSDGAALALVTLAGVTDSKPVRIGGLVLGIGAYALGAPIIHGFHERYAIAAGDTTMRIFTPMGTALIGTLIGLGVAKSNNDDYSSYDNGVDTIFAGFVVGGCIGIAGSIALDALVWARDNPKKPEPSKAEPSKAAALTHGAIDTILPSVAPTRDGFSAGLGGTF